MGTRRTRNHDSASLISDLVPTYSDEVTRPDLAMLQNLRTTDDGDVFAEDTLELFIDTDASR